MRVQQALFAYADTLAKTILTCMPEPPADAKPQAVARAKARYERLLKSARPARVGHAKLAMQDLLSDDSPGTVACREAPDKIPPMIFGRTLESPAGDKFSSDTATGSAFISR